MSVSLAFDKFHEAQAKMVARRKRYVHIHLIDKHAPHSISTISIYQQFIWSSAGKFMSEMQK